MTQTPKDNYGTIQERTSNFKLKQNDNNNQNNKDNLNKEMPIIDQIFEKRGYCLYTYKHIFLTFLVISVEGLHMSLFSSMIIPFTSYYNLNESNVKFLSSILFLGVGLGSLTSGYISSKYSRPYSINCCLFLIFISNLLLAFSENLFCFAACRFIIGISLGLIVPVSLNLLTECLPIKNRSLVLTCIWIAFSIGNLYNLILMLNLMPFLQKEYVFQTLLFLSLLPLFTLIISLIYLQDSPRNLIMNFKEEEALKILEHLNENTINDISRSKIIAETRLNNYNNNDNNSLETTNEVELKDLFSKKYKKLTSILTIIWFLNSVIGYGPVLVASLTLSSLGVKESITNNEIILNQIMICVICSPSCYIGGVLSEVSFLGRNKSTILSYFISILFMCLCILDPSSFTVMFGLSIAFSGISFNINTTYTCEVYPTKIRDNALGFLFFSTRLGGFISQILYLYLNDLNIWAPYYFTIFITFVNIYFVYILPYETLGQPLDKDYCIEEEEIKILTKEHNI